MSDSHEVIRLCNFVGKYVPRWTQGAGSNISVKNSSQTVLYIKGSGLRLDEVIEESKVALIDLPHFLKNLKLIGFKHPNSEREELYARLIHESGKPLNSPIRASMETGFHALIDSRYVIHIHSLVAIAIQDPKWSLEFQELLQDLPSSFAANSKVTAKMPGLSLSLEVETHKLANLIFLQNHGVILHCTEDPISLLQDFLKWEDRVLEKMNWNKNIFHAKNLSMEWNVYTPDAAVFEDKILGLTKTSSQEDLISEKIELIDTLKSQTLNKQEENLIELFLGSAILYHWNPSMKTLSEEFRRNVSQLPTENFRKG